MPKKLDIRNDIFKRYYRPPYRFWHSIYYIVGRTRLLGAKYNPKFQMIDKLPKKGPAIVIWNHGSRRDHTFICTAVWPRVMSMVSEYNEFFRDHLHWAFMMNKILPKKVYDKSDFLGIKAIDDVLKKGGVVALSPEGNTSNFGFNQPAALGTGRLLKHFNVPIYMMRIDDSYLSNSCYLDEDREGRVDCKFYKLFTPEQLQEMSEQELEDKINAELRFDDYEWNKTARVKFKHKSGLCVQLDDMCYKCPKCGEEFSMVGVDNEIYCSKCGNGAHMDDYFDFHPYEGSIIPESPSKWVVEERASVIKEIREDDNYRFDVDTDLGILPNDHYLKDYATSEKVGEGKLIIDHQGLHYRGTRDGQQYDFDVSYNDIFTFNIPVDLSRIAHYYRGNYHEFRPHNRKVCTKIILLVEEMHRLHVNAWKNFPWFDYLYEPYKK